MEINPDGALEILRILQDEGMSVCLISLCRASELGDGVQRILQILVEKMNEMERVSSERMISSFIMISPVVKSSSVANFIFAYKPDTARMAGASSMEVEY